MSPDLDCTMDDYDASEFTVPGLGLIQERNGGNRVQYSQSSSSVTIPGLRFIQDCNGATNGQHPAAMAPQFSQSRNFSPIPGLGVTQVQGNAHPQSAHSIPYVRQAFQNSFMETIQQNYHITMQHFSQQQPFSSSPSAPHQQPLILANQPPPPKPANLHNRPHAPPHARRPARRPHIPLHLIPLRIRQNAPPRPRRYTHPLRHPRPLARLPPRVRLLLPQRRIRHRHVRPTRKFAPERWGECGAQSAVGIAGGSEQGVWDAMGGPDEGAYGGVFLGL